MIYFLSIEVIRSFLWQSFLFINSSKTRFPKCRRLNHTRPPENNIKYGKECYLQLYPVQPVGQIPSLFQDKPVPRQILEFYENNKINRFTYDRPYHQGERDKNNEIATLWIERRSYRTAGIFPGILRWFEVEDTAIFPLSPLEIAVSTVKKQNDELISMINEFSPLYSGNFDVLTRKLAGTVDPAVAGGFSNYEKAFLNKDFLDSIPSNERRQAEKWIHELKSLMAEQMPILEQLLINHNQLIRQNESMMGLLPLQEQLTKKFHELKSDVEEKYGRQVRHSKLNRQTSSIARRQSKKSSRPNVTQNRTSQDTSSSGSRPNSALEIPEIPMKVCLQL